MMHDGLPGYGVRVKEDKTLVNFEVEVNGRRVKRVVGERGFPFVGVRVDVRSLGVGRDRERGAEGVKVGDALTVEGCGGVGRGVYRKTLSGFAFFSISFRLVSSYSQSWRWHICAVMVGVRFATQPRPKL